jgi:hypothetical protein
MRTYSCAYKTESHLKRSIRALQFCDMLAFALLDYIVR